MARHVYRCPLRWSDMDAFQHVNNTVFLRYLEEARVDFMFTAAADEIEFAGGIVVARHEIDYRRPLTHRPEPVLVETWVERISAASVQLRYEIKDEVEDGPDVVYAEAASVLVPYDMAEKRPRRFSEAERAYLKGFGDERAGAGAAA